MTIPTIVPCEYVGKNQIGDFAWMIEQDVYANSLFVFNDKLELMNKNAFGNGNAWVRKYTINNPQMTRPQAANVPVASIHTGGFQTLDTTTLNAIDAAVAVIHNLVHTHTYDTLYFAAKNDHKIATDNYNVSSDVRNYITSAIQNLA